MDDSVESIIKLGFREVGKWELKNGDKLYFSLLDVKEKKGEPWIYAFVVGKDKKVKYIGEANRKDYSLKGRMEYYRGSIKRYHDKTAAGISSIGATPRIIGEIEKALKKGEEVFIYAMSSDEVKLKGVKEVEDFINFAAGLESGLIKEIKPEWNIKGKGETK